MADTMPRRVTEILQGPEFSTFNQLLRRSKVIADIDNDSPFTIFAPTNDAFEKLPDGTLGEAVEDSALLRELASFHVAPGMFPRAELRELDSVATLTGRPVLLECVGQGTMVGGASITNADLAAENGFVHVIDTVMFPE